MLFRGASFVDVIFMLLVLVFYSHAGTVGEGSTNHSLSVILFVSEVFPFVLFVVVSFVFVLVVVVVVVVVVILL